MFHTPLQPDGTESARLNVDCAHAVLSLSFTVTVKFAAPPELTHWVCVGEIVTLGLARLHVPVPNVT